MTWSFYCLLNKLINTGIYDAPEPSQSLEIADPENPNSLFIDVPHVKQLHSWDCGLACVAMALKTVGAIDLSVETLSSFTNTTSLWTVDLAFLLKRFSVEFSYFTVTLGANPNYSVENFYKEQLPTDLLRVDTLFKRAVAEGFDLQRKSLSKTELSLLILSGNFIAIVLVDLYKLSYNYEASWIEEVVELGARGTGEGYIGHYIVVCGYDEGTGEFEIRDPGSCRNRNRISAACLELARKSYGTDEDLLLIHLNRRI